MTTRPMTARPRQAAPGTPAPGTLPLTELAEMKARRQPIVMVTAYDAPGGRLADAAGADVILVGDSAAMVVLGHDSTVPSRTRRRSRTPSASSRRRARTRSRSRAQARRSRASGRWSAPGCQ